MSPTVICVCRASAERERSAENFGAVRKIGEFRAKVKACTLPRYVFSGLREGTQKIGVHGLKAPSPMCAVWSADSGHISSTSCAVQINERTVLTFIMQRCNASGE